MVPTMERLATACNRAVHRGTTLLQPPEPPIIAMPHKGLDPLSIKRPAKRSIEWVAPLSHGQARTNLMRDGLERLLRENQVGIPELSWAGCIGLAYGGSTCERAVDPLVKVGSLTRRSLGTVARQAVEPLPAGFSTFGLRLEARLEFVPGILNSSRL